MCVYVRGSATSKIFIYNQMILQMTASFNTVLCLRKMFLSGKFSLTLEHLIRRWDLRPPFTSSVHEGKIKSLCLLQVFYSGCLPIYKFSGMKSRTKGDIEKDTMCLTFILVSYQFSTCVLSSSPNFLYNSKIMHPCMFVGSYLWSVTHWVQNNAPHSQFPKE